MVGNLEDRHTPGGIERHIDATVRVLRAVRSRVVDAGLRLALENHAGDLQARELRQLVEEAGPDFVGVCLDAGNPLWALEDPHLTLETLAPYVLTSHVRDSAVWRVPDGAAVLWTRMGEGSIGIDRFLRDYVAKCPGRPVSLEIIVLPEPRIHAFRRPGFWEAYRHMPAWEFDRFLALADAGSPVAIPAVADPVAREVDDVEASLRWTKAFLEREGAV